MSNISKQEQNTSVIQKEESKVVDYEEDMDEEEWREEFQDIINTMDHEGDFCVGDEVTFLIQHCTPKIVIDGMSTEQNNEELINFPLMDHQAQCIRSLAEKAPFGKGMETVLDESVRKAWQIDASKIQFQDSEGWENALCQIVNECTTALGMNSSQRSNVHANLYKLLLYEPGGHFKKHRDTEKEPGMFGTLIIQLPSYFTGGALVIEHAGEKRTMDFSSASVKSHEEWYATAFYADCQHELLPVESGWRLCLAYNLVLRQSEVQKSLPSASALMATTQRLRKLANNWSTFFHRPLGYLLEHDYTETNLHFTSLKGNDSEVVNLLREVRDVDGNPLFVACLMLISKHEVGSPTFDYHDYHRRYDYRHRGFYDEEEDEEDEEEDQEEESHTMEEVHETDVDIRHWIGPDDKQILGFRLDFDLENDFLGDEDVNVDELFGEDPAEKDYEDYTGNAGPTLAYWYYRSAVVFWPRSMNMEIMKSAGLPYMLSYLQTATKSETIGICNHILEQLEQRKISISSGILIGISKSDDDQLLSRALKFCKCIPDSLCAQTIANIFLERPQKLEAEILELVRNTSTSIGRPLQYAIDFVKAIEGNASTAFVHNVKNNIVSGALQNAQHLFASNSAMVSTLAKISFEVGGDTFESFFQLAKTNTTMLSPMLKRLISLGEEAVKDPSIIELASIRARRIEFETRQGKPVFSWKQPNANFPGSHAHSVNAFLKGVEHSSTFHGFNGIGHARNWANKYFGRGLSGLRNGYSATATIGGRGSSSYATVTKTREWFEKSVQVFSSKRQELRMLEATFGDNLKTTGTCTGTGTGRHNHILSNERNGPRQMSGDGRVRKTYREEDVIVIDDSNSDLPKKARREEIIIID